MSGHYAYWTYHLMAISPTGHFAYGLLPKRLFTKFKGQFWQAKHMLLLTATCPPVCLAKGVWFKVSGIEIFYTYYDRKMFLVFMRSNFVVLSLGQCCSQDQQCQDQNRDQDQLSWDQDQYQDQQMRLKTSTHCWQIDVCAVSVLVSKHFFRYRYRIDTGGIGRYRVVPDAGIGLTLLTIEQALKFHQCCELSSQSHKVLD